MPEVDKSEIRLIDYPRTLHGQWRDFAGQSFRLLGEFDVLADLHESESRRMNQRRGVKEQVTYVAALGDQSRR